MSIEEKFKSSNIIMQGKLKAEIEKTRNGSVNRNLKQLIQIQDELVQISNKKQSHLNYPRYIIDSWDYQDELGIELLDLAELYKRWK